MAAAVAFPGVNHFEAVSDDIDLVNSIKTDPSKNNDMYTKSEFDKDKVHSTQLRDCLAPCPD